jgi:type IV pilus assembly protein PilY1
MALAAMLPAIGYAGQTDIASAPLFTTTTSAVKPNVMFVLDDSGSMAWDFMPDDADYGTSGFNSKYGRRASQCNGLAFNPEESEASYALPKDATGADVSVASTAFLSGTATSGGSPNYLSSGSVNNTTNITSVSSPASVAVSGSGTLTLTMGGSYSSYYVGMVVSVFGGSSSGWWGGTTYSSSAYMIGKVSAWDASTRVLKIDLAMSVGTGSFSNPYIFVGVGSPIDNVYYTYTGSVKPALSFDYSSGAVNTETTFFKECNSPIGADPGKTVFAANIVTPGSPIAQRYANWYYYYSTRMRMMKTSMTLAFDGISDKFRVGFNTINENTGGILDIKDFDSAQKTTFYSRVNGANPNNNTPLRAALSKIGSYYAKKLTGQTYDPVQYSCQKNFTILSTDGYWNSSAGYKLDGTAVGQQDGGATPRPMYDGGSVTSKTVEKWDVTSSFVRTTVTPYTRTDIAATKTTTPLSGQMYKTYTLGALSTTLTNSQITRSCSSSWWSGTTCVVSVTTSDAHGLSDGMTVTISGVSPSAYNGTYVVDRKSNTRFEYTISGLSSTPATPTTGNYGSTVNSPGGCPAGQGLLTTTTYTRDKVSVSVSGTQTVYSWSTTEKKQFSTVTHYTRTLTYVDGVLQTDQTSSSSDPTTSQVLSTSPSTKEPGPTTPYTPAATETFTNWVSTSATSCAASKPADGSAATATTVTATTSVKNEPANSTGSDVAGSASESNAAPTETVGSKTTTTTSTSSGGSSDSLADVAMYYYQTDLRDSSLGNCTGALGTSVCGNDVKGTGTDTATWQHMTTFTLSLGVSGTLQYDPAYETQKTGDFALLNTPSKNWPVPSSNAGPVNIDDLWHAAVNGRGHYFSAKNPTSLATSLRAALTTIDQITGASSAAATSTLQPVEGDNGVYIAEFDSGAWTGDLKAYSMNIDTGAVATKIVGTNGTSVDLASWSARKKLTSTTSRTIYYMSSGTGSSGGLKLFTYANLQADGLNGYFDNACSKSITLTQCTGASAGLLASLNAGADMVSFLRGQDQSQYRTRAYVLGDIVNSSPVYVGKPSFNYTDSGYAKFKSDNASRGKTLYVGANDGMLHAFNAEDGVERWAYVPRLVMDKLYRLADSYYESKHLYTVDATPVVGDVYDGTKWRTILVGGLNAGGSGYYALDITDPANPVSLWEFTNSNLGLSFGNPVITKRKDGTWVVAFTSGYNNADGDGHLFVVSAITGSLLKDITTGAGGSGSPSGLGKLNAWIDVDSDNSASRFYAGDLLGNIWRFDIDGSLEPKNSAFKLAQLVKDGVPQPITTRLELAEIEADGGKHVVVYAGTGRYLGKTDITNTEVQSIYAIKDALGTTSLGDVRAGGTLVAQTLVEKGNLRTIDPPNPVDWATKNGWYVDLLSSRERVNVDMQLAFNMLTAAGNIPGDGATDCTEAGRGTAWIYQLNVLNGKTSTSTSLSSMVAGLSTVQLKDGTGVTIVTKTDATTPQPMTVPPSAQGAGKARRSSWRELID